MTGISRPRPIRIVFLVEGNNSWLPMLKAIFTNCYSRWGGRFNLIIPCEHGVPKSAFLPWIERYDPDIIYSYADLEEDCIRGFYERFDPSYLVKHRFHGDERDQRAFRPALPLAGLNSISTCLKASLGGPYQGPHKVRILDKHPSCDGFPFFDNNFGSNRDSNGCWPMSTSMQEYAEAITLVSKEVLNDPRMQQPQANGEHVSSEEELCDYITNGNRIIGPSLLSAWDTPRIELSDRPYGDSFNLIIGDQFNDYLLYWNLKSHQKVWLDRDLTTLLISKNDLEKDHIYQCVLYILRFQNHVRSSSNSQSTVSIRSSSLNVEELNAISEKMKEDRVWFWRNSEQITDLDVIAPNEKELEYPSSLIQGGLFRPSDWYEVAETTDCFRPSNLVPPHIRDFSPLRGEAREGMWAQDFDLDKKINLSRYVNVQHKWRFSRRLKITDALVRGYQTRNNSQICVPRINSSGMLSLFAELDGSLPEIKHPNEDELFHCSICSPLKPWPFTNETQADEQAPAFGMRLSDKGQYLRALLNYAGNVNEASDIFLHRYWLDRFEQVGATPSTTEIRVGEVTATLKKRLKSGKIEMDAEWERVAKLVLKEARNIRLSQRYLSFADMQEKFDAFRTAFWEKEKQHTPDEAWNERERLSLRSSTQYLISKDILHQGLEWRCPSCANNNWVSIDALKKQIECEVCGNQQQPPVSFDWHFKLSGFILEGLREHGLLASIWCLSKMGERARSSFYFCEAQELFCDQESYENRTPTTEIDLIAVVDGTTYLCDVKSSSGDFDVEKFVSDAQRLRPDIALFAVMDSVSKKFLQQFKKASETLQAKNIRSEIIALREGDVRDDPHLPDGRTYSVRYGFG